MSPINQAPQRGYSDWARINDWDSPLLWNSVNASIGGVVDSPILDVSRFGYLAGNINCTLQSFYGVFTWYSDVAGTSVVATRTVVFDSNMGTGAQLRIPNLGPFVKLELTPTIAQNYGYAISLLGTNRYHPLELIPRTTRLVQRAAQAIANGVTDTRYPTDYYSGPVALWFSPSVAGLVLVLQEMNINGAYVTINTPVISVPSIFLTTTMPAGAWRVQITNNSGAAQTYSMNMEATLTGSI